MANKIILLSMLMISVTIRAVQVESLDCPDRDRVVIEKIVHSNKALSEADDMLYKEYKAALQTYPYKNELKSNQGNWIWDELLSCEDWCTNVPCLLKLYKKRIDLIRSRYSTYFYGGDKLTGEYRKKNGVVSILLLPGKKIKFYILTVGYHDRICNYGEDGNAIATLVNKYHAIFLDNEIVNECLFIFKFDKNRVTLEPLTPWCDNGCGMADVYLKKSNKAYFPGNK